MQLSQAYKSFYRLENAEAGGEKGIRSVDESIQLGIDSG